MFQLIKLLLYRTAINTSVYLCTKAKSVVITFMKQYGTNSVYESVH